MSLREPDWLDDQLLDECDRWVRERSMQSRRAMVGRWVLWAMLAATCIGHAVITGS